MKLPIALLAVALSGVATTGCGSAGKSASPASEGTAATTTTTATTTPGAPAASTGGSTQSSNSAVDPDHDDHITEDFGHAASDPDKRAVTAVLKAYYAAALAGDGATTCSMIVPSFAKSVPEDYGQASGPAALRGKTCSAVMSKLFKQQHQKLASEVSTMVVRRVRLKGNNALAFLAFKTSPEPRYIGIDREGGAWKVSGLLDNSLP